MVGPTCEPLKNSLALAKEELGAEPVNFMAMFFMLTELDEAYRLNWAAKKLFIPTWVELEVGRELMVSPANAGLETVTAVIKLPLIGNVPETLPSFKVMSVAEFMPKPMVDPGGVPKAILPFRVIFNEVFAVTVNSPAGFAKLT